MTHIGIDASRATAARRTGTEIYTCRLLQALLDLNSGHRFTFYFREPPPPDLFTGAYTARVMPFPRGWTHVRLAWDLLVGSRPEVLFVPAHVLPALCPTPAVVTVHDLGYRKFPGAHPLAQRLYLDGATAASARAARRVIADSVVTQQDLVNFYKIPESKIAVVYPGIEASFQRVDPASVRAGYDLSENYLLHVGTLQPRKNIERLIDAFLAAARVPQAGAPCPLMLVLVGRPGWLSVPILEKIGEHPDCIRLLDKVPEADLPGLYSGARALVFPSLYEGFGFPVLEAMACGTPVICSNTSSLPEVAGDAALLVDPLNTEAIALAILRLLNDLVLRATLVDKGAAQVKKFSWEKAAQATLDILLAVAQGRPA